MYTINRVTIPFSPVYWNVHLYNPELGCGYAAYQFIAEFKTLKAAKAFIASAAKRGTEQ